MNQLSTKRRRTAWGVAVLIVVLLAIDQIVKVYIKTHFALGESVRVTDWFFIEFIENNGMAWGMSFINKLTLSLFRIAAIAVLSWYLCRIIKAQNHKVGYVFMVALVLTGAIGNMIDSIFYGLVFNASSPYYVSYAVPFGTGYADVLMGKVVDMFRFPFFTITWPEWLPLIGGRDFTFFDPVFNFADACVTTGVLAMLLFYRGDLEQLGAEKNKDAKADKGKGDRADKNSKTDKEDAHEQAS